MGIAGGNDGLPTAHSAKCGRRLKAEFPSLSCDQVSDFMGFEMPPHILYRIEFGRVSRQSFDHETTFGGGYVVF